MQESLHAILRKFNHPPLCFASFKRGAKACLYALPAPAQLHGWVVGVLTKKLGPTGSATGLNCTPFHKGRGIGVKHAITLPPEEKAYLFQKAKPSLI